jgi:sugar phosphate isomerase/epimerase
VILSGLADEVGPMAAEQFAAFAALGLQYYCLRTVDLGSGVKNAMNLTLPEVQRLRHLQDECGLNVSSLGSAIGKVTLCEGDDGAQLPFVPFAKYLGREVKKACELAHALEAKLIRGFSFIPPKLSEPREHLAQTVDQLGQIAEACHRADLGFGVELHAGTVGATGQLLAEIHRQVNHPGLLLVFDAANILSQGFSPAELFQQYLAMKPELGWMHIKDYRRPEGADEKAAAGPTADAARYFVPADVGQCGHEAILRDFKGLLPALEQKLGRRGIAGVFLEVEPHLKVAGPSGGFSGPDGMGVAVRALTRVLDYVGIDYHLRDFADIRAARGY